jgi:hypothetical protein
MLRKKSFLVPFKRVFSKHQDFTSIHTIPRRAEFSLFFGRYISDKHFDVCPDVVKHEVTKALADGDQSIFTKNCFSFISHLEDLEDTHPLWLNSNVMFNGEKSFLHHSYKSIFDMCFTKALAASNPKKVCTSNFSGYYFVGPRGIGKSVLLQTCCLVSSQLLPNFAAVYIDGAIHRAHPLRLHIAHAVNNRTSDPELAPLTDESDINDILRRATGIKCALGLFIDEAHCLYANQRDWPDMLACLSSVRCAVFLSGSSHLLPPMVRLRGDDKNLLNRINTHVTTNETLNTTKLTQQSINGFSSPEQYLDYFRTRQIMFNAVFPLWEHYDVTTLTLDTKHPRDPNKTFHDEIVELHTFTGGRVRAMIATCLGGRVDLSSLVDFSYIEDSDKIQLHPFFDQIKQGRFNPFKLPVRNIGNGPDAIPYTIAQELLQKKLLTYVSSNTVTLACPAVYLLGRSKPTVFISHAQCDTDLLVPLIKRLKEFAQVVCSSDSDTQLVLSDEVSLKKWESDQISAIGRGKKHFGMVVLSKAYSEKVNGSVENGCKREWELLNKYLSMDSPPVIFTYLNDYIKDVNGTVKETLVDRPLLTFHESNLKTFFSRLLA